MIKPLPKHTLSLVAKYQVFSENALFMVAKQRRTFQKRNHILGLIVYPNTSFKKIRKHNKHIHILKVVVGGGGWGIGRKLLNIQSILFFLKIKNKKSFRYSKRCYKYSLHLHSG